MFKKLVLWILSLILIVGLFPVAMPPPVAKAAVNNPLVGQAITPWPSPLSNIVARQNAAGGRHIDVISHWQDFGTTFASLQDEFDAAAANGSILELTLQPTGLTTLNINSGSQDAYLTQLATDMKNYNKEIWIRLMHEWNGNWYSWSVGINGNTNATYISAWQRVINIFRNVGATKVKFEWNVNLTNSSGNTFMGAYPGNNYVDFVGVDVYNWGTAQPWSTWQSFDQAAWPAYSAVSVTGKPVIISEWGSGEPGGSKAQWITDAFNVIRFSGRYDLIDAVIWFDVGGYTPDFRIDTSPSARTAYNQAIQFTSDPVGGGGGPTPTPGPTATWTNTPVPGSCGTTNVSLNKATTTSSIQGAGFEGAKAVDGSTTTRWSAAFTGDPQWIRVDLGSTQSICRVKLNWETAYATAYQIQVSNDGTNFTTIYSTTTGNGAIDDLTGLSGSGRYVRMYGTARCCNNQYSYSLWEFDIYTGSAATNTPTGPTATPTNTSVPPTNTPTNTPVPPTATPTRTNTPVPTNTPAAGAYDDEFNVSTLAAKWSWIRQDSANWSLTAAPGFMRITCQAGEINGTNTNGKNILIETAPTGDWTVITKVTGKPTANWAQAGILIYQDDNNWVKVDRLYDTGNKFQFAKEIAGTYTYQNVTDGIAVTTSYLKIIKTGTSYSGYYSADGVTYTQVGTAQTVSLSTIKLGLMCYGGVGINGDFDWIHVTQP